MAGDIVAIARLEGVRTGDTLVAERRTPSPRPLPEIAEPLYAVAIKPKDRLDEAKVSQALARLLEEDPSLRVCARRIHGRTAVARNGRRSRQHRRRARRA